MGYCRKHDEVIKDRPAASNKTKKMSATQLMALGGHKSLVASRPFYFGAYKKRD